MTMIDLGGARTNSVRMASCLAVSLLSGCGKSVPMVVRIPVAVACVEPGDIPPPVPMVGPIPDDARAAADILGAKVLELRATDRSLRALLGGCVDPPNRNSTTGDQDYARQ